MKIDIEKEILNTLKKNNGMMIEEISQNIGVSRVTASKYLAILEALGMVTHKEFGRAKLFFIKKGLK